MTRRNAARGPELNPDRIRRFTDAELLAWVNGDPDRIGEELGDTVPELLNERGWTDESLARFAQGLSPRAVEWLVTHKELQPALWRAVRLRAVENPADFLENVRWLRLEPTEEEIALLDEAELDAASQGMQALSFGHVTLPDSEVFIDLARALSFVRRIPLNRRRRIGWTHPVVAALARVLDGTSPDQHPALARQMEAMLHANLLYAVQSDPGLQYSSSAFTGLARAIEEDLPPEFRDLALAWLTRIRDVRRKDERRFATEVLALLTRAEELDALPSSAAEPATLARKLDALLAGDEPTTRDLRELLEGLSFDAAGWLEFLGDLSGKAVAMAFFHLRGEIPLSSEQLGRLLEQLDAEYLPWVLAHSLDFPGRKVQREALRVALARADARETALGHLLAHPELHPATFDAPAELIAEVVQASPGDDQPEALEKRLVWIDALPEQMRTKLAENAPSPLVRELLTGIAGPAVLEALRSALEWASEADLRYLQEHHAPQMAVFTEAVGRCRPWLQQAAIDAAALVKDPTHRGDAASFARALASNRQKSV